MAGAVDPCAAVLDVATGRGFKLVTDGPVRRADGSVLGHELRARLD